jgi:hypothetical protein
VTQKAPKMLAEQHAVEGVAKAELEYPGDDLEDSAKHVPVAAG